ncbi:MAG TPA: FG-GAP-like repeat-containing protein [Bacteroidales bacterium]|nr:FG-GAP-like repeat-containing protein [Bacteroidales bacterium]
MRFFHTLVIALLFFSTVCSQAQPSLKIDTIYFPQKEVRKVRISYNGEIWFFTGSPTGELYRITRTGKIENKTGEFASLLSNGLTDFVVPDTNQLIAGTNDNFVFHYSNGTFKNTVTDLGLAPTENHINSLYLTRQILRQNAITFADQIRFGVATNGNAYQGTSFGDKLYKIECYNQLNRSFLSKNDPFLLDIPVPHLCSGLWMSWPVFDNAQYGRPLCGNIDYYQSGSILYSWIGFEKGYVTKTNYDYTYPRYLESQAIRAMADYDDRYVLIAADSGIYYSNTWQDPHKIDLPLGNIRVSDIEVWQGNVYAATEKGLIRLISTNCNDFKISIDQNVQYGDTFNQTKFLFEPVLYGATKRCKWDFGDGTVSDQLFPVHTFNSPGNYRVTLEASNGECRDTVSALAVVFTDHNHVDLKKLINLEVDDYTYPMPVINIADLDGDQDPDLFSSPTSLYNSDGKTTPHFTPIDLVPDSIIGDEPFNSWVYQSLVGDMNNDGLNDIVANTRIFINKGNFRFDVISIDPEEFLQTYVENLLDYNYDGLTDIIIGTDYNLFVYINKGSFRFEKKVLAKYIYETVNGIRWIDIDNDNDNDIVVSGVSSERVFLNQNGEYTSANNTFFDGFPIDRFYAADMDNDRKMDFYFSSGSENFLYKGTNGKPVQYNDTWLTNERNPFFFNNQCSAYNVAFSDLDNNGYTDCIKNTLDNKTNRVFLNQGNMIFVNDTTGCFEIDSIIRENSITAADISNDGRTDVLLWDANDYDSDDFIFLNNTVNSNNWIKFHCFGSRSNINAIGSKVFIKARISNKDTWQYRVIEASVDKYIQNGYEVHFGLGDAEKADTVEILWTSGHHSIYTGLEANKTYNLIEPLIQVADTLVCENVRPFIHLPFCQSVVYEWQKNGLPAESVNNRLKISSPGVYRCVIHYDDFNDTTSSVTIHHLPVSRSEIRFAGDSIFCPGDSALISSITYPGAEYKWSVNGRILAADNDDRFYCRDSMSVQQFLTNAAGCVDTSNVLLPGLFPSPVVQYENVEFCRGDSAKVALDTFFTEYNWSNGDTTSFTWVYENEPLSVRVMNEFGCISNDTINYAVYPRPYFELGENVSIGYTDTYSLIQCYSDPYTYLWNDTIGFCSKSFSGDKLNIGDHKVKLTIINQYGCFYSDSIQIEVLLSVKDAALNDKILFVFPNPADTYTSLYINGFLNSPNTVVDVFNSGGILVDHFQLNVPSPTVFNYDVTKLRGLNILRLTANGKSVSVRLIKN